MKTPNSFELGVFYLEKDHKKIDITRMHKFLVC